LADAYKAEALNAERPLRTSLSNMEIERIAEYLYAAALAQDDEMRRDGTGSEAVFQTVARQFEDAGVKVHTQFQIGTAPEYGLTEREWQTGHAGGNSVARGYGAKDMMRRFGLPALADAVNKVAYPGLDLSGIRPSH
jgi:hypothetical protein